MTIGFQTGATSWKGVRVRRGIEHGKVISDYNDRFRTLSVRMENGNEREIVLNNIGPNLNQEELSRWEWYWDKTDDKKWYRF